MTTTIDRSFVVMQKTATFTAVSALLVGTVMAMSAANAATEVTVLPSTGGSTTVVEQYSDGKTAVITATPNSIGMQDGMPFAVTQVTNVPRYVVRQVASNGVSNTVVTQGSVTVTSVPVTNQITNQSSRVDVIAVPTSTVTQVLPTTQILPVTTATQLPVINTSVINAPVITTPMTTITSIEALQLKPTFSTPDVVNAQTKVMKILKNSDGREVAVPANHIAPGDVIEYYTVYTNTTAQPVTDINAMVSLPNGVRMVSLNSPLPTLATTGGDSYQTIQQVGNTVVVKENYSGLKWNLVNLSPKAAQTVVIRAKVQ
ncbi:hypothetical protein SC65A3_01692 [Psychrobacter sp. SC65A.3]|uniref:hypothetical protein n=1 Tax=Psychrobacter sp. SC65A.3 TaxID=2983299 RepID=UPI0021D8ED87|nr:hypothetical protein [Psychrobacter sp. SC65A.3]WAI88227.1 hypothetical protein SC65A3_01692 [Psychrobacter sp. SC65A.3]